MSVQLHDLVFEPFITDDEIQERVEELGNDLKERFQGKNPVFLGMLSGAFVFMADLIRAYDAPCETSFVKYTSYEGTESTGVLTQSLGVDDSLKGKTVIIVEDIVDSGNTMTQFLPLIKEKEPAEIIIVTLLFKPSAVEYEVKLDYIGFEINDVFVVGYGLDYDGLGRNLRDIYKLKGKA